MNKETLIELLRKNGIKDIESVESADVTAENLILFLRNSKCKVNERFFDDLAALLDMPRVRREDLIRSRKLASILPYGFINENLIVPIEIGKRSALFATANPLNEKVLLIIRELFPEKNVEIEVGSIDAIKNVIEEVYQEIHKNRAIWDLYYRAPGESAYKVLVRWQFYLIVSIMLALAILFIVSYPFSLVLVFVTINIAYFLMNPFRCYVVYKGIRNKHRTTYVSEEDVKKLNDEGLPVYTFLIPLYKEVEVLSHIMDNIYKMDYPKDRIDVKILLEEDDEETINEARRLGLGGEPEAQRARAAQRYVIRSI